MSPFSLAIFLTNQVSHVELCNTHAVIAAAPKWEDKLKLAGREELAQLPWIFPETQCIYHKFIEVVFSENNTQPSWITSSATEDSTIALLRSGVGLAFIRDDEADVLLKKGEIVVWQGESFTLPLRMAYLESRKEDPVIKALLEIIVQNFDKAQNIINNSVIYSY